MQDFKQVLVVRSDLSMGKGKLAAQCAHASLGAYLKTLEKGHDDWVEAWQESGQEKVVVKVESKEALLELFQSAKGELPAALIKDAGRTQLPPGTPTCVGLGPAPEPMLDKYTAKLKLL